MNLDKKKENSNPCPSPSELSKYQVIHQDRKNPDCFQGITVEQLREEELVSKNTEEENEQSKKKQEKSVLTITKFLNEELEFLKEEHISIQDSDPKWSWLTNELAEKYFISVLLPYYIIRPKITYEELIHLGFQAFRSKLQRSLNIHFSDIKNKYLNLDRQDLIKFINNNFGTDKTNKKLETAKIKLEKIIYNTCRLDLISRNRDKIKLCLDLGFSPIKCKECEIGINLLVALQFHHPEGLKEIILRDLYREDYNIVLKRFKNDKVELLCSNHHLEKQLFYPIVFKEIIFKENLFSMSADEIDIYINDYLSIFVKSEKYKEILYSIYTLKNLDVPSSIYIKWRYQIKNKWIKKRFVFKELFNEKCIVCGDSNILHLGLHHIDPNLKDNKWSSIATLHYEDIIHLIINERCVCLCSNCHTLITYKYHLSIRDVLKGYLPQQEIDKISEEITLKYNNAIEKISKFKFDIANINFKSPLNENNKENKWEIHLMTVYFYLEIKERTFFFKNEILYDLELSPNFISFAIKKLIDMDYVQKSDSLFKYSLTEKGKDKSLTLIQKHKEKANKIQEKVKEYLNNKGK